MLKYKKSVMWFVLLTKRLICKIGFLSLLVCIILSSWVFSAMSTDGGGITRIALYSSGDDISSKIIENLTCQKSIISYVQYGSEKDAIKSVESGNADAAWIFNEDFERKLKSFLSSKSIDAPVLIVEREDNVSLRLSREKLFCAMYPSVSYSVFENFVRDEIPEVSFMSDSELRQYYDEEVNEFSLINIKTVGSDGDGDTPEVGMLTAPLRGFLALAVMVCILASTLYFVSEKEKGRYAHLPKHMHILPAGASCLGAGCVSGLTALISIWLSGINLGFAREIASMMAYVWSLASLCTVLAVAFESSALFGAMIPFFVALVLLICPIFFNVATFDCLRFLLPTYHYLMSLFNTYYIVYMIVYGFAGFFIAYAVSHLKLK